MTVLLGVSEASNCDCKCLNEEWLFATGHFLATDGDVVGEAWVLTKPTDRRSRKMLSAFRIFRTAWHPSVNAGINDLSGNGHSSIPTSNCMSVFPVQARYPKQVFASANDRTVLRKRPSCARSAEPRA